MSHLLDTHAFLWWTLDDSRLSDRARQIIEEPEGNVFLSAASAWEIAIKFMIGKLALRAPLSRVVIDEPTRNGIATLPISSEHASRTGELPLVHRDPFDRMLVAQAQVEDLTLVTRDRTIRTYAVRTVW